MPRSRRLRSGEPYISLRYRGTTGYRADVLGADGLPVAGAEPDGRLRLQPADEVELLEQPRKPKKPGKKKKVAAPR